MFYIIYKITNNVNGKFYIGMHKTKNIDDGYFGSGKRLKNAIKHYGKENFTKDILHVFDQEWKMKLAERILVVADPEVSYNLCPGGHGGFGYVNSQKLNHGEWHRQNLATMLRNLQKKAIQAKNNLHKDEEWNSRFKHNMSLATSKRIKENGPLFLGKKHSEDTKRKMSTSKKGLNSGTKNSQFGSYWATNGTENIKIKMGGDIPEGWYKGRV